MISDLELDLNAFLGSPFGASVAADIGQEPVALIFLAGARAQLDLDEADFNEVFRRDRLPNNHHNYTHDESGTMIRIDSPDEA